MAGELAGRVAWVTGASAGLGRGMAREFARRGADVVVSARRKERLDELVAELSQQGVRALALPCDVTREDELRESVAHAVAELGQLDIAVANAGFSVNGRIEDLEAADWRRQLETNVIGAVSTARAALPELRKTQGRVALVGSVSAFIPLPRTGAYSASKAALRAIGEVLSLELRDAGVSCTTLHPGFVESEISLVDNQGRFDPERRDKRPKRFMWSTEDAARVMVDAIWRRKREFVFTRHGQLGAWLGRHAPGLVHFALSRGGGGR
jgi:NAD(P)-dependent dehydrogenase (short-subunit alcohol dehydrogenase family)